MRHHNLLLYYGACDPFRFGQSEACNSRTSKDAKCGSRWTLMREIIKDAENVSSVGGGDSI